MNGGTTLVEFSDFFRWIGRLSFEFFATTGQYQVEQAVII